LTALLKHLLQTVVERKILLRGAHFLKLMKLHKKLFKYFPNFLARFLRALQPVTFGYADLRRPNAAVAKQD